jgi:hypothetical protein
MLSEKEGITNTLGGFMSHNNDGSESDVRKLWLGCREITKGLALFVGYLAAGQGVTEIADTILDNRLGSAAIATVVTFALAAVTLGPVARILGCK